MTWGDLNHHHSDIADMIADCDRVGQALDDMAVETSTPYLHTAAHWVRCSIATLKGAMHAIDQSEITNTTEHKED
ncbi:MAG: hypothetical protein H0U16_07520 [Actinobacteria bacterium]|nr:hypothetical protein [Actinomycetota bacterium]